MKIRSMQHGFFWIFQASGFSDDTITSAQKSFKELSSILSSKTPTIHFHNMMNIKPDFCLSPLDVDECYSYLSYKDNKSVIYFL